MGCPLWSSLTKSQNRRRVSSELRVAVKRACALLDDVSMHHNNAQLIAKSLSTCIMDDENGRDAAKIWAAWTDELIVLYPPAEVPPPPPPAFTADSPESPLRCTAIAHSVLDGMKLSVAISFAGRSISLTLRTKPGLIQRISAPCGKQAPESGVEEAKSGGTPPRELACFPLASPRSLIQIIDTRALDNRYSASI